MSGFFVLTFLAGTASVVSTLLSIVTGYAVRGTDEDAALESLRLSTAVLALQAVLWAAVGYHFGR
ncbi:hypothetical protein SAMN05421763_103300 [[Luteovulum] sphaeroides subsp. megalophilum]|uniref:hypothetical protein n=1 Tax=Cereibacter sphaeroides TaxID=1063 RepID=UPI000B691F22|nr:hypothetical protein [Cereibacter sphaeroides]SNS87235.1 hypothetical protein SAMN05421763_103300 [[Luteovulum] sphaeroides subsp. megalophilum]